MARKSVLGALLVAITLLLSPGQGMAANGSAPLSEEAIEAATADIASEVMSPFCAGRLLRDCPSSRARELRLRIREQLAEGKSRAEVLAYLRAAYGDEISAAPEFSGLGALAWILPGVLLFAGLVFLAIWLKLRREEGEETSLEADPEALKRLEAELAKRS